MIRSILFILSFGFLLSSNAQSFTNQKLSLGLGTAYNYYRNYETGVGAGFRLSYVGKVADFSVAYIEAGGSLAYSATDANFKFANFSYRYVWNSVMIAPRINAVFPMDDKFNMYIGSHIGGRIVNFRTETTSPGTSLQVDKQSKFKLHAGIYAGADYSLNKNFKVFGEAGYDFLWFTLGLKLNIPE